MQIDEVKTHLHIIFGADNMNTLSIARSLGEADIRPLVIMAKDGNIPLIKYCRYVKQIRTFSTWEDAFVYLVSFANSTCKPFVYTSDDGNQCLLDQHYDELIDGFYFFNGKKSGQISYYTNKDAQCKLAKQCGFITPKFEVVERGILPKTLSYPVFTKTLNPCMNGWKKDVTICYSSEELKNAYEHMVSEKFILQEYVEKIGKYSVQGLSIDGGKNILMPFERMYLRFSPTSFGGYMYYQPFVDNDLREKITQMIQKISYTGCFEIEFLVDKYSQLYFLEINLRFSASNYGITYGGVNLPYIWSRSILSGSIRTDDMSIKQNRYYVMNEGSDISYIKQVGLFSWIRQFIHADSLYLWHSNDIMPAISFWWNKALRKLYKIM